jgi:hypothetical protein
MTDAIGYYSLVIITLVKKFYCSDPIFLNFYGFFIENFSINSPRSKISRKLVRFGEGKNKFPIYKTMLAYRESFAVV